VRLSATLSAYIGRQFLLWFGVLFGGLIVLVLLFDLLEFFRRAATRPHATMALMLQMSLLRLPTLAQILVPFAVLFGAMFAFWRLTRSQELVIVRSAGVSIWQFLAPTLAFTLLIAVLKATLVGPFAATLLGRAERLEEVYFNNRSSASGLFPSGLWLRQTDGSGHAVLHAQRVVADASKLEDVIVFRFGPGDRFLGRIDAEAATLRDGRWELSRGRATSAADPTARSPRRRWRPT
jgi:lipopolysaccharide export system permease protein